jgi:hypothetical protein
MERPPTEQDTTEDVAVMANSSWVNDVSTLMTPGAAMPTTRQRCVPAGDVTCEALHLALTAIHMDMAWHAGVMSAEASMEALHREVGRTTNRYKRPTQASAPEAVSRVPSQRTVAGRATDFGGKNECESVSYVLPSS